MLSSWRRPSKDATITSMRSMFPSVQVMHHCQTFIDVDDVLGLQRERWLHCYAVAIGKYHCGFLAPRQRSWCTTCCAAGRTPSESIPSRYSIWLRYSNALGCFSSLCPMKGWTELSVDSKCQRKATGRMTSWSQFLCPSRVRDKLLKLSTWTLLKPMKLK